MEFIGTCVLETTCYEVTFRFKPIRDHGYISAHSTLEIFRERRENLRSNFSAYFNLMDLPRLIAYFEDHIAGLKTNPQDWSWGAAIKGELNYENVYVFVDQELNFTMQALLGVIEENGDGGFSLRFMYKDRAGLDTDGNINWVNIGAEGRVYVSQIRNFIASIRQLRDRNREHFLQSLTEGQLQLQKVADFYRG